MRASDAADCITSKRKHTQKVVRSQYMEHENIRYYIIHMLAKIVQMAILS